MKYIFLIFTIISAVCILSLRCSPISEKEVGTDFSPKKGEVVLTADVQGDPSGANAGSVKAEYYQLWGTEGEVHVHTALRAQKTFGNNPTDTAGAMVKLGIPVKFQLWK